MESFYYLKYVYKEKDELSDIFILRLFKIAANQTKSPELEQ